MAEEKAPYTLTVELDSSRPDALAKAMDQLRDIAAECDTTGKAKATIKFESYKQADLNEIMDTFEEWLYQFAIGLGCQMKVQRPGLRPENMAIFRERYATPMDDIDWGGKNAPPVPHGDYSAEAAALREQEIALGFNDPIDGEAVITPDTYDRMALPAPRLMLTVADGDYVIEDEREGA